MNSHTLRLLFFWYLFLFPRPRLAECYPRRHPEATGCASNSWLMALSWPLCRRMLSPSSSRGHRLNFLESRNQHHPLFSHIVLSSNTLNLNTPKPSIFSDPCPPENSYQVYNVNSLQTLHFWSSGLPRRFCLGLESFILITKSIQNR